MDKRTLGFLLLLAAGFLWFGQAAKPPEVKITPTPAPDSPAPKPKPRPWGDEDRAPVGAIVEGGPAHEGREVATDLPVDQRTKNVGGTDGAGLCVFSSIGHAARWQNERRLVNFQKDMRQERGGGYPAKVDKMIAKYGAGTPYIQYEGRDLSLLREALATGRMPSITYDGRDVHYRGTIAHMVNLVYLDDQLACVLDNNFVGEKELVWLDVGSFSSRFNGGGSGWAVILLGPPPPPPPRN